jgi:tRNA (guanine37-N1)-methyltransferase
MFPGPLAFSLAGNALESDLWRLRAVDIRSFTTDRHQSVDDTPFGGGAGMVMRPDIVARAVDSVVAEGALGPLLYLNPRGRPLRQDRVRELAAGPGLILLCGRYEGVDARVIEARGFLEVSLGDFVLSGGEIASMALIDACVRLLPGVVGDSHSLEEESFASGLLEYPHYTRPQLWEGRAVPEVLLSGNHARIARWRQEQAVGVTRERRPDLLAALT